MPSIRLLGCLQYGNDLVFLILSHTKITARSSNIKIYLIYKPTKQGLPSDITFEPSNFARSIQGAEENEVELLTNLRNNGDASTMCMDTPHSVVVDFLVTATMDDDMLYYVADILNLI